MKISGKLCAYLFSLTMLAACGGGGGSDDTESFEDRVDIGSFAGTWRVSVGLIATDCPGDITQGFDLTHVINQNGVNVAVEDVSNGISYSGTTIDDGLSFVVTNRRQGQSCSFVDVFRYDALGENNAAVSNFVDADCGPGRQCSIEYHGAAIRQ